MLLAELFVPAEALALPVFARQYKVPCSSCHSAIPRRNEYGDAFFKNGYQWPGESGTTQTGTIDDATKMRGVALYEGLLQSLMKASQGFIKPYKGFARPHTALQGLIRPHKDLQGLIKALTQPYEGFTRPYKAL